MEEGRGREEEENEVREMKKMRKREREKKEEEEEKGRGEADFFLENMIKKKIINLQPEMDHESATCAGWLCKL